MAFHLLLLYVLTNFAIADSSGNYTGKSPKFCPKLPGDDVYPSSAAPSEATAGAFLNQSSESLDSFSSLKVYETPLPVISLFSQDPFLGFVEKPSQEVKGVEEVVIDVPHPQEKYIWELSGYYHAKKGGQYTFSIGNTEGAILKVGTTENTSNAIQENKTKEIFELAESTSVEFKQNVYYSIIITYVAGIDLVPIYVSHEGTKENLGDQIKQVKKDPIVNGTSEEPQNLVVDSGFYYKSFVAPVEKYYQSALRDTSNLEIVQRGKVSQDFTGLQVTSKPASNVIEIKGHFSAPEDGKYNFALAKGVEAAVQIGPCDRQKKTQYTMDSQWEIIDTRVSHTASLKFQTGFYYPFRLVVIGKSQEFVWDVTSYTPSGVEVDLFGLWSEKAEDVLDESKDGNPKSSSSISDTVIGGSLPTNKANSSSEGLLNSVSKNSSQSFEIEKCQNCHSLFSSHLVHTGSFFVSESQRNFSTCGNVDGGCGIIRVGVPESTNEYGLTFGSEISLKTVFRFESTERTFGKEETGVFDSNFPLENTKKESPYEEAKSQPSQKANEHAQTENSESNGHESFAGKGEKVNTKANYESPDFSEDYGQHGSISSPSHYFPGGDRNANSISESKGQGITSNMPKNGNVDGFSSEFSSSTSIGISPSSIGGKGDEKTGSIQDKPLKATDSMDISLNSLTKIDSKSTLSPKGSDSEKNGSDARSTSSIEAPKSSVTFEGKASKIATSFFLSFSAALLVLV